MCPLILASAPADATIIYAGTVATAGLSSVAGVCTEASQSGYVDTSANKIVFQVKTAPVLDAVITGITIVPPNNTDPIYPVVDFLVNDAWKDPCPLQYPHYNWTYFTLSPFVDSMYVGFDLHTMTTVMALNFNLVQLSSYMETESMYGPLVTGGLPGKFYIDQTYLVRFDFSSSVDTDP